jgi:hypothetical protein
MILRVGPFNVRTVSVEQRGQNRCMNPVENALSPGFCEGCMTACERLRLETPERSS